MRDELWSGNISAFDLLYLNFTKFYFLIKTCFNKNISLVNITFYKSYFTCIINHETEKLYNCHYYR